MAYMKGCDFDGKLFCNQCHYSFTSELEFNLHCLAHQSDPIVSLVKLSDLSLGKLKDPGYKVDAGMARGSRDPVSPLRISLKKQEGSGQFQVVKTKRNTSRDKPCTQVRPKESSDYYESYDMSGATAVANMGNRYAEGNELYERSGTNAPPKRKINTQTAQQLQEETDPEQGDDGNTKKKYSRKGQSARQTASGAKSAAKRKSSALELCPPNEDLNLPEIRSRFTAGTEDANWRKISITESEMEKLRKTTILEKLRDMGFALVPVPNGGKEAAGSTSANEGAGNITGNLNNPMIGSDVDIFLRPKNTPEIESNSERNKNPESNPLNIMEIPKERSGFGNWPRLENNPSNPLAFLFNPEQRIVCQDNPAPVAKKRPRRSYRPKARDVPASMSGDGNGPEDLSNFLDTNPNIYIRSACESNVGGPASGLSRAMNPMTRSPGSDNRRPRASRTTCTVTRPDQQFNRFDDPNNPMLVRRGGSGLVHGPEPDSASSRSFNFDNMSCGNQFRPQPFVGENYGMNVIEDEVAESPSPQPSENSSVDEPPQGHPMPSETASDSGVAMNRGLLQSFFRDPQNPQGRIHSEGLNFMSLEMYNRGFDRPNSRRNFDMGAVEQATPMEHLSQQVHRLANAPMGFMPHMQAPHPYPVLPPLVPHHAGPFDRLVPMQAPLPPALYQGYGMYNQNYPVPPSVKMPGPQFPCSHCTQVFASPTTLESHMSTHRASVNLPFRCERCPASYPTSADLEQHELIFHHQEQFATPELGIPIIDLNYPGVRDQLARCGVNAYMPLSQLESNSFGYFGIPVAEIDASSDMAVSNFSMPGATHVLVLGKMKPLSRPQPH